MPCSWLGSALTVQARDLLGGRQHSAVVSVGLRRSPGAYDGSTIHVISFAKGVRQCPSQLPLLCLRPGPQVTGNAARCRRPDGCDRHALSRLSAIDARLTHRCTTPAIRIAEDDDREPLHGDELHVAEHLSADAVRAR